VMREVVLGQSAYDENDALSPVEKTYRLAKLAYEIYRAARAALRAGVTFEELDVAPARRALAAVRDAPAVLVEAQASLAAEVIAAIGVGSAGASGRSAESGSALGDEGG